MARKGLVIAAFAVLLVSEAVSAPRPVSVQVSFIAKRGQKPVPSESVVWLQPLQGTRVPPVGSSTKTFQMTTRSKTLIPGIMAVPVGSTIQFPNEDPISHNLFSLSAKNSFDLGLYRRGAGKSHTFTSPGIVNVYCNVHPNMSAVIHVVDTPYYAMANEKGVVTFQDVAPGRYRLGAWNERAGSTQSEIEVRADGSVEGSTTVTIDGRSHKYSPAHVNKEGKPYPATKSKDY